MGNDASSVTVQLQFPVTIDGQTIAEVTLHRPKGKHMRVIAQAEADRRGQFDIGAVMLAELSGLPAEAIDELDLVDFQALSEAVVGFFPKSALREAGAALQPTWRPH